VRGVQPVVEGQQVRGRQRLVRALQDPAHQALARGRSTTQGSLITVVRRASLAEGVAANGPRAHYMRARLEPRPGLPGIRPFDRQDPRPRVGLIVGGLGLNAALAEEAIRLSDVDAGALDTEITKLRSDAADPGDETRRKRAAERLVYLEALRAAVS
jgi:hypothetical protein